MRVIQVKSSQIERVGYDIQTERLRIKFHSGQTYEYTDVPPDVVVRVLYEGASIGSTFHAHVKKGGYAYKKIEDVHEAAEQTAEEVQA
jgi:hypothetical protein